MLWYCSELLHLSIRSILSAVFLLYMYVCYVLVNACDPHMNSIRKYSTHTNWLTVPSQWKMNQSPMHFVTCMDLWILNSLSSHCSPFNGGKCQANSRPDWKTNDWTRQKFSFIPYFYFGLHCFVCSMRVSAIQLRSIYQMFIYLLSRQNSIATTQNEFAVARCITHAHWLDMHGTADIPINDIHVFMPACRCRSVKVKICPLMPVEWKYLHQNVFWLANYKSVECNVNKATGMQSPTVCERHRKHKFSLRICPCSCLRIPN